MRQQSVEEICAGVKGRKARDFCERIIAHARRKRAAAEFEMQEGKRRTRSYLPGIEEAPEGELAAIEEEQV